MINGSQDVPFRITAVNGIVLEFFATGALLRQIRQAYTGRYCQVRQFVNRGTPFEQMQAGLFYKRHPANLSSLDLN